MEACDKLPFSFMSIKTAEKVTVTMFACLFMNIYVSVHEKLGKRPRADFSWEYSAILFPV